MAKLTKKEKVVQAKKAEPAPKSATTKKTEPAPKSIPAKKTETAIKSVLSKKNEPAQKSIPAEKSEPTPKSVSEKKGVKSAKTIVEKKIQKKEAPVHATKQKVKDDKEEVKQEVKDLTEFTKEDADRVQVIKDQSCSALAALRKYLSQAGGKSLFPDIDHALQLLFVYKKPAICTKQSRHKIVLPKSHKSLSNTSVCLIMPDLDKSEEAKRDHDVEKQSRQWADKIEEDHGITKAQVAKIFTKTELQRTTHAYKDKRALASSYDLFLVDARVGKTVCVILGKDFRKSHKKPMFFDYGKPLATTIDNSIKTVNYPLDKYMTRASVNIGHLGQESEDILANIATVLDESLKVAPGGLRNIRGIYLQTSTSKPSLPIYADDGSSAEIKLKVEKPEQRRENQKITGECSTLPDGLKVEVRKDGKIRVLKEADGKAVLFPTIHDEWDENDLPNTKPSLNPSTLRKKKQLKRKLQAKRKEEAEQVKASKKLKTKS